LLLDNAGIALPRAASARTEGPLAAHRLSARVEALYGFTDRRYPRLRSCSLKSLPRQPLIGMCNGVRQRCRHRLNQTYLNTQITRVSVSTDSGGAFPPQTWTSSFQAFPGNSFVSTDGNGVAKLDLLASAADSSAWASPVVAASRLRSPRKQASVLKRKPRRETAGAFSYDPRMERRPPHRSR
jgi:hypothetical protein